MGRGLVSAWVSWIVVAVPGSLLAQASLPVVRADAVASAARGSEANAPGLRCLQQAYPAQICSLEPNALVTCGGERFVYDDGRAKTPEHGSRLRTSRTRSRSRMTHALRSRPR